MEYRLDRTFCGKFEKIENMNLSILKYPVKYWLHFFSTNRITIRKNDGKIKMRATFDEGWFFGL